MKPVLEFAEYLQEIELNSRAVQMVLSYKSIHINLCHILLRKWKNANAMLNYPKICRLCMGTYFCKIQSIEYQKAYTIQSIDVQLCRYFLIMTPKIKQRAKNIIPMSRLDVVKCK